MRQMLYVLALAAAIGGVAGPASAVGCPSAAATFVEKVGKQVTDTVANASMSSSQRLNQFRAIFRENADFPTMGRVALGTWWNKLPESRRGEYYGLVENLVVRVMFARLEEFAGQQYGIAVRRCNPIGTRGKQFLVEGPVQTAGGNQLIDVAWSILINRNNEYKVLDVQVAGVWLTLQKREEFDSFLRANGGDVAALLADLHSKVGT